MYNIISIIFAVYINNVFRKSSTSQNVSGTNKDQSIRSRMNKSDLKSYNCYKKNLKTKSYYLNKYF